MLIKVLMFIRDFQNDNESNNTNTTATTGYAKEAHASLLPHRVNRLFIKIYRHGIRY